MKMTINSVVILITLSSELPAKMQFVSWLVLITSLWGVVHQVALPTWTMYRYYICVHCNLVCSVLGCKTNFAAYLTEMEGILPCGICIFFYRFAGRLIFPYFTHKPWFNGVGRICTISFPLIYTF